MQNSTADYKWAVIPSNGSVGKMPVNTNGGQIGEAYIHDPNGVAEIVR
jgi:hypothetical protein